MTEWCFEGLINLKKSRALFRKKTSKSQILYAPQRSNLPLVMIHPIQLNRLDITKNTVIIPEYCITPFSSFISHLSVTILSEMKLRDKCRRNWSTIITNSRTSCCIKSIFQKFANQRQYRHFLCILGRRWLAVFTLRTGYVKLTG